MSAYRKNVVAEDSEARPGLSERVSCSVLAWRDVEVSRWVVVFLVAHAVAIWSAWLLRLGDIWLTDVTPVQVTARGALAGLAFFFLPGGILWAEKS